MKFDIGSHENFSARNGEIVELRHQFYIAVCMNGVGSYDIFPYWNLKKIKFSIVEFLAINEKFTFNSRSYRFLPNIQILHTLFVAEGL